MSDLFKKHAPRMSEAEDERVWRRVGAAALRPVPWWEALWARPAVRFGLPAVAVVLVALVWVAVEQPASTRVPPARREALERATPPAPAPAAGPASEPAPQPAPHAARRFAASPAPRPAALPPTREPLAKRAAPSSAVLGAGEAASPPEARVTAIRAPDATAPAAPAPPASGPAPLAPASPAPAPPAPLTAQRPVARALPETRGFAPAPGETRDGAARAIAPQTEGALRAPVVALDRSVPVSALAEVGALIGRRPLDFTATLPVAVTAPGGAPEAAHVVLGGGGGARVTVVAAEPGVTGFADVGRAEQILLVACAADRVAGTALAPRSGPALLAQARRLAGEAGPERAAAQALYARLARTFPTPAR